MGAEEGPDAEAVCRVGTKRGMQEACRRLGPGPGPGWRGMQSIGVRPFLLLTPYAE